MLVVVDFGATNVRPVARALAAAGTDPRVTADPAVVKAADRIVLPGAGDFAPARRRLAESGLDAAVTAAARAGRPLLAVCLGLQLCCDGTEEADAPGLGLLPGRVVPFPPGGAPAHVGWAEVTVTAAGAAHPVVTAACAAGTGFFYHVHRYHPASVPDGAVLATAVHEGPPPYPFATIVGRDSVLGVQFHPEKSQDAGLALLAAFAAWTP
jgi:glutamine amidotransferase